MEPTLIAGLATACVSLIGVLAARQSSRRLYQEHQDEQARLRLDAAMRAGALISSKDAPATPASIASGLLALTRLDHADLAVTLLVDLWAGDNPKVATETAVLVIDDALRSTNPTAQLVAAELLYRNAKRLDACQSLHWPSVIDGVWNPRFSPKTKVLLLQALMRMTLREKVRPGALRSVAVRLYGVWKGDPDKRVRGCIGTLICAVVPKLRVLGYSDIIQGNQKVMLAQLEEAAATGTENPDTFMNKIVDDLRKDLVEWAETCVLHDREGNGLAAVV